MSHRRSSKPSERYIEQFYPPSITIPYGYTSAQPVGMPFSAPPHFPNMVSPGHHAADPDGGRRPPFKHMQSAPGSIYTLHHTFDRAPTQESYSGPWPPTPGPPHYNIPSQDSFHPPGQELSNDPSNAFWKLSVTSPTATAADLSLPPPRPQNQWANNNYTHERPANSSIALPTPHNSFGDSQTLPTPPQFYTPNMSGPVAPMPFQGSPQGSSHSSQPHEEHCEANGQWSRSNTSGYRSGGSS